ncbi:Os10g0547650 [Oryza sativa Japonica Group]|uniref:Os10g0547650 protein n=1 Tax=Oryza sativa subsp. japonica TaxID=39947 RepID=A0A0P0XXC7_ORYSJ|nr:hypothetical protein EE612_052610 [Oryza sativa]BAT11915.1 Os10g0547650 [Oryza sativa Japonica Group]
MGYLVEAWLGVAEVDDDEGDGGRDGGPRHVEAEHVGDEHADGDHVREALEEQLPPVLRALHEPPVLRRDVLRHHRLGVAAVVVLRRCGGGGVAVVFLVVVERRAAALLDGLHLLAGGDLVGAAGAAVELLPVHAEQHEHVDPHAGEHGGEDAEEEGNKGDLAVEGDDQVLRVADGRRAGADVGAGGEREQERLRREVALGGELEHELGEDDAAGVVGEERAGERGDDADAAHEVAPALAPPRQQPAQVPEHAGVLEVAADDHGGEEEAQDGEVDGGVGVVGADHVEHDHQHRAQQRPRRPPDRQERHRREHRQHPEHTERHRPHHHLRQRRQRHGRLSLSLQCS